jgi:hypothetical protein
MHVEVDRWRVEPGALGLDDGHIVKVPRLPKIGSEPTDELRGIGVTLLEPGNVLENIGLQFMLTESYVAHDKPGPRVQQQAQVCGVCFKVDLEHTLGEFG